jgi:DNA-binding NtrC family response regulator
MNQHTATKTVVLIVEDEALIRMDVADYISDAGLDPLEAASADEAIDLLQARQDIGVVFTDVNMPGSMNGLELSRVIAQRWPEVRVIITSGMVRPTRSELEPSTVFYAKPYDLESVVLSIKTLAA